MVHDSSDLQFSQIPELVVGELIALYYERPVRFLVTDSRKPIVHEGAVFFAIAGRRHDGHSYIQDVYKAGIRQFIVERDVDWTGLADVNVIKVNSAIEAIQRIAIHHRQQYSIPVIGVTGSNGKTIVKEWLYQLLSAEYHVIKNPGSYNSQLGVPLSVWQMQQYHTMGIFEGGISLPGEMERLEAVIRPTWGVFTNIGTAHDENFTDRKSKVEEKLKLFARVEKLIYSTNYPIIHESVKALGLPALAWGSSTEAEIIVSEEGERHRILWGNMDFTLRFPFTHQASIENALHCVAVMLMTGYDADKIQSRISALRAVPMRLELKDAINRCQLIDDSYNNDLAGLQISVDFLLNQRQKQDKIIILSDILQSGLKEEDLVDRIASMVNATLAKRFIGIGPALSMYKNKFTIPSDFYTTTDEFVLKFNKNDFREAVILVKGARVFGFERIISLLQKKVHGTVMEVNLGALVHNLNVIRSMLKSGTGLMVMVKAFAYGSGSVEIANLLQFHQVDFLGVAYVDEGVMLRENHITVPIMVMNPSADGFQTMVHHNLQPEIYSLRMLNELVDFLNGRKMKVHLKLDTGMNRLGFTESDQDELITTLKANPNLEVVSVFSHLAGSDDPAHDKFSRFQAELFLKMAGQIERAIGYKPLLHILNTAGILRLPQYQFDMVRLGIGLYGVDTSNQANVLQPAATLKTTISQIRTVREGETIGYGRKGVAHRDMKIATIAIGYADGYSRTFSNGVGYALVNGRRASVIGNVCMDMTMVDVTGIDAKEGDEAIIFGDQLPITEVASWISTIPYEILTNTSERVKRVFIAEGW